MNNGEHPSGSPTTIDPSSIDDKVRKLLAKAERTDNAHEAEAFSRKAAQLIALYRLDPDRLHGSVTDVVELRRIVIGQGGYQRARLQLLCAVARSHDCRVITEHWGQHLHANVIGVTANLDSTELLYMSLHSQAARGMSKLRRNGAGRTLSARRSFLLAFAVEVDRMLAEVRQATEQTLAVDSFHPAVVSEHARIDDFIAANFGRLGKGRGARVTTLDGWDEGTKAATASDIGRARLDDADQPALPP